MGGIKKGRRGKQGWVLSPSHRLLTAGSLKLVGQRVYIHVGQKVKPTQKGNYFNEQASVSRVFFEIFFFFVSLN